MPRSVSHLRAIGYALLGFTLWVLTDAGIKFVAEASIPPYEVIGFLGATGALFMLLKETMRRPLKTLWPAKPKAQFIVALSSVVTNLLNAVALKHLPLTIFYIVVFMAPMIIALLAALFLSERLDAAKIVAIVAGFFGVVIAVNPMHTEGVGDAIGYVTGIAIALSFAINIILSRAITQSEDVHSLTFFNGLIQALFCLGPALYYFTPLSMRELIILSVAGLLNVIANLAMFKALKHTTAATVSQFHYTQIIMGAAVGYLIWHEIPTLHLIVGAFIIAVSGLYIAARARKSDISPVVPF